MISPIRFFENLAPEISVQFDFAFAASNTFGVLDDPCTCALVMQYTLFLSGVYIHLFVGDDPQADSSQAARLHQKSLEHFRWRCCGGQSH